MAEEEPKKTGPNKKPDDSEKDGDEDGSKKDSGGSGGGNIASPEGILMLCTAGIIDVISFIPVINVVSGILGTIIIGGWFVVTRTGQASKAVMKKIVFRFIVVFILEYVPIASVAPCWTWFVYKTLKDG